MKKIIALVIILFGIILGIVVAQRYLGTNGNSIFSKTQTITINDQKFKLDIADSEEKREIGLSDKSSLPEDQGLLFIFDKPDYYSFWMKSMKFPIDIIFIRDDTIVTLYENVEPPISSEQSPPIYQPLSPANAVLEINAGLSSKYGFKEGDKVKIENL